MKNTIQNKEVNLNIYKNSIYKIPIDEVDIKNFTYANMNTTIYSSKLINNINIEYFFCKAYRSFIFNQFLDKSIEWRLNNSALVLKEIMAEKPIKLISDSSICIDKILLYYIGEKNFNILNIDINNIQNIAFVDKKIDINYNQIKSDLTFIFTTHDKIYLVENCIDC